jgi:hypothetical protein
MLLAMRAFFMAICSVGQCCKVSRPSCSHCDARQLHVCSLLSSRVGMLLLDLRFVNQISLLVMRV